MHVMKKIFKSGGSYHIVLPMTWIQYLKSKFGNMPKEVSVTEVNDDLLIKAVNDKDGEG